ncbi:hypothetical protein ACJX0J_005300, partial [Zea mays]
MLSLKSYYYLNHRGMVEENLNYFEPSLGKHKITEITIKDYSYLHNLQLLAQKITNLIILFFFNKYCTQLHTSFFNTSLWRHYDSGQYVSSTVAA